MIKHIRSSKGFVAMLDALIALFLLAIFGAAIIQMLQQGLSLSSVELQKQGMSVLTVLEYTNSMYSPQQALSETSDSVCISLSIYNGTSATTDAFFTKTGCPISSSNSISVWRSFVSGTQLKTVQLMIWLKD